MKFINSPIVLKSSFFFVFFLCCSTVLVEILSALAVSLLVFPVDNVIRISFSLAVKRLNLIVFSEFSSIEESYLLKFSTAKLIVVSYR